MSNKHHLPHIVMIGTTSAGGISAVLAIYRDAGLFQQWGIEFIPTHRSVDAGFPAKLWAAISALSNFCTLLVRGQVRLLHAHTASRASFWRKSVFVLLCKAARKPVVIHIHSGEFIHFYYNESGEIAKWYISMILNHAETIIVLTEGWKKRLSNITRNSRIVAIPNPIIASTNDEQAAKRTSSTLLYLGRITHKKGVFDLLDVIAELRAEFVKLVLICAGEGDISAAKEKAAQLGIENHVQFTGWVDEDRKDQLINLATVMVLPSYAEGLPMSVLEAMAAGLPVVATDVGGIPDVITSGDNGLLVTPGDKSQLREALRHILRDESFRQRISDNARQTFLNEFRAETIFRQVSSIYEQLLNFDADFDDTIA